MSESDLQVRIYDITDDERADALEALRTFGLTFGFDIHSPLTELTLGEGYGSHSVHLGGVDEFAALLNEMAPSAVFETWQDPHPDADGHYLAHHPAVGTFEAGCDAEGNPHLPVSEIKSLLAEAAPGMTVSEWLSANSDVVFGSSALAAVKRAAARVQS